MATSRRGDAARERARPVKHGGAVDLKFGGECLCAVRSKDSGECIDDFGSIAGAPEEADEAPAKSRAELSAAFSSATIRESAACERLEVALPRGGVRVLERGEFGAKFGLQRVLVARRNETLA